jgi:iron complex transport system substrate-binding protein
VRIASLIASGTEILFALGLGPHVVGVSHECDFPPAARRLPRLTRSCVNSTRPSEQIDADVRGRLAAGGALYAIDSELLCRMSPEVIVTQAQCDVCAVRLADVVDLVHARPELAGCQVIALQPRSLADLLCDIGRLGAAAQVPAAAEALAARLRERVAAVERATSPLPESARPTVICIEWTQPAMTAGNWTPELVELAGGRPLLARSGQQSQYVAWDAIRAADPEVLIIAPCGFNLERSQVEAAALTALAGYRALAAVRRGRAFVVDGNSYLNRSGPRLVDSLELLAALLHPDLFPAPAGELAEGRAWSRL